MARKVTCVNKDPSGPDDCRCITEIGFELVGGTITKSPRQVHDDIENGKRYYVMHGYSEVDLVAAERDGTKYVRTEPTDTADDNLLQQPSCN